MEQVSGLESNVDVDMRDTGSSSVDARGDDSRSRNVAESVLDKEARLSPCGRVRLSPLRNGCSDISNNVIE